MIDRGEVPAIPGPQAVTKAIDLAVTGKPGQRHRVKVGKNNALPRGQRVFAVLIGA